MKKFSKYQDMDDGIKMHLTDKQKGSKFWNEGKWENYVVPFLPKNCKGLTYVDMGCNAGLFLKLAEERGFSKVVGIESGKAAVKRGLAYRDKHGYKYDIQCRYMERSLWHLPMADYVSFINSHYYLLIHDWLDILDRLQFKTMYCIITTTRRTEWLCNASSHGSNVKRYFKNWKLMGVIPQLPIKDDPCPRSLWNYCFKTPSLEKVPIGKLEGGQHVQGAYYKQLDEGVPPLKTRYFKMFCKRHKTTPRKRLEWRMHQKVKLYEDVKKNGIKNPIIVNHHYRVLDGNHRYNILKYLGYKKVIVRKIA
jgi:hypothetical protein